MSSSDLSPDLFRREAPPEIADADRASPPPDDPQRRHHELDVDHMAGLVGTPVLPAVPGATLAADDSELIKRLAELRLEALRRARARLAVLTPAEGGDSWVPLGPTIIPFGQTYSWSRVLVSGRVTAIVVDPTDSATIYVGTAQGGVWKSVDGGVHWSPTSDNEISLAIGALAIDPSDHLVLYAGTGEGNFSGDSYYGNGVLKTVDGGATWSALGTDVFMGQSFGGIVVTPGAPARVFGATNTGVYRSLDAGATWARMTNGLPPYNAAATGIAVDPTAPATVYAAFAGLGIYRTSNADASQPVWERLAGSLPTQGFGRIALALAASSPQTLYVLMADSAGQFIDKLYRTADGGATWAPIALPNGSIGGQGFYNLHIAVDPTNPDTLYLSGVSVWKATRDPAADSWTIVNIGATIHPDNHAFAFDPASSQVVYAGNDGGIYRSADGGATWSDAINAGLCITQFEFMDQHPTSDALIIAGTQDNGTEQFRNSPVFYHADDGDGGYVAIDPSDPRTMISTYYGPSPKRSTSVGAFGSWMWASNGLAGDGLFYPPLALDQTNSQNIAFGTNQINLDPAQGMAGWPTKVALPGWGAPVSAIAYVNSNLIYVGMSSSDVHRLVQTEAGWTVTTLRAPPLPYRFIWDIAARPDDENTIVVVMSGFFAPHVWRCTIAGDGTATWADISGSGAGRLPDIPVNALVIDPDAPDTMYIATDVAVFRTLDNGETWTPFSEGLPNCAVFDMKLHQATRLLRVATHGRGLWERPLDGPAPPESNIMLRANTMHTGRTAPPATSVPAAFDNFLNHAPLGWPLWWWHCADIKVDVPMQVSSTYEVPFQFELGDVDYMAFEQRLSYRGLRGGRTNRIYVQVHNRGTQPVQNTTVKLLACAACAAPPDLPADFWDAFPGDSADTSHWLPVGDAQVIPTLLPGQPAVVSWEWAMPAELGDLGCVLALVDAPSNPIAADHKLRDVRALIFDARCAGLRNTHLIWTFGSAPNWAQVQLHGDPQRSYTLRIPDSPFGAWQIGLLLPAEPAQDIQLAGFAQAEMPAEAAAALEGRIDPAKYDLTKIYQLEDSSQGGALSNIRISEQGLPVMVLFVRPQAGASTRSIELLQEIDDRVLGGCTFVIGNPA